MGIGSAASRTQALSALFQFVHPNAPKDKQINLEQDFAASVTSYQQADQYARSHKDADILSSDDSLITLENQIMATGGMALAGDGQDHIRHGEGHVGNAEQLQQQCEQNDEQDAAQCFHALIAHVKHIDQHLQFLQGNTLEEKAIKDIEQRTNLVMQYAKHLGAILQTQQDQVPPEQQMSEEHQYQMTKLQMDDQRKNAKLQADEQRKNAKLAADIGRMDRTTSADILLKANRTRTDIASQRAKTTTDIATKRATAASKAKPQ